MQKLTKKELQVGIPIICATTLNLMATFVKSVYVEGLLQGMAIILLVMSCIYMFPGIFSKQKEQHSKRIEHGNN